MNLIFKEHIWQNKSLTIRIWRSIIKYIGEKETITLSVLNCNYDKFDFLSHREFPITYKLGRKLKSFDFDKKFKDIKEYLEKKYPNLEFSLYTVGLSIKIKSLELKKEIIEDITDLDIAEKLINLSKNAKQRNIYFEITFSKLKRLWNLQKCQITGEPFINKINDNNSKTIDRFDNDRGYIDSNIIICTKRINDAKGDLSLKEIMNLAKYAKKKKFI